VSYQTQERYWTDYVRIATPIVGLLLLLGVFWFWASSLIGDSSDSPPATQAAAVVTVIPANTPTPTATSEVVLNAETPVPTQAEGAAAPEQTSPPESAATDTPEETTNDATAQTSGGGEFTEGQTVVTNDEVRMRSDHSTDSDIVDDLQPGVSLTVLNSEPFVDSQYTWWNVQEDSTGKDGWVVQDYLSAQ
jgi:uncharacterized protein YgiM (DUF1202 family)